MLFSFHVSSPSPSFLLLVACLCRFNRGDGGRISRRCALHARSMLSPIFFSLLIFWHLRQAGLSVLLQSRGWLSIVSLLLLLFFALSWLFRLQSIGQYVLRLWSPTRFLDKKSPSLFLSSPFSVIISFCLPVSLCSILCYVFCLFFQNLLTRSMFSFYFSRYVLPWLSSPLSVDHVLSPCLSSHPFRFFAFVLCVTACLPSCLLFMSLHSCSFLLIRNILCLIFRPPFLSFSFPSHSCSLILLSSPLLSLSSMFCLSLPLLAPSLIVLFLLSSFFLTFRLFLHEEMMNMFYTHQWGHCYEGTEERSEISLCMHWDSVLLFLLPFPLLIALFFFPHALLAL